MTALRSIIVLICLLVFSTALGSRHSRSAPDVVYGARGKELKLNCFASENDTPVQWYKEKQFLPSYMHVSDDGQEVTIPDLREPDAGTYECVGGGSSTRILKTVIVHVLAVSPP